jgi:hypothetical protein
VLRRRTGGIPFAREPGDTEAYPVPTGNAECRRLHASGAFLLKIYSVPMQLVEGAPIPRGALRVQLCMLTAVHDHPILVLHPQTMAIQPSEWRELLVLLSCQPHVLLGIVQQEVTISTRASLRANRLRRHAKCNQNRVTRNLCGGCLSVWSAGWTRACTCFVFSLSTAIPRNMNSSYEGVIRRRFRVIRSSPEALSAFHSSCYVAKRPLACRPRSAARH